MFHCFTQPRVLIVAAGFGLILATAPAVRANEPNPVLTPAALTRTEHIMGSGGLGSPLPLEETVIICEPLAEPTSQHLMGSGGLGSQLEETLIPADSGNCWIPHLGPPPPRSAPERDLPHKPSM